MALVSQEKACDNSDAEAHKCSSSAKTERNGQSIWIIFISLVSQI